MKFETAAQIIKRRGLDEYKRWNTIEMAMEEYAKQKKPTFYEFKKLKQRIKELETLCEMAGVPEIIIHLPELAIKQKITKIVQKRNGKVETTMVFKPVKKKIK